MHPMMHMCPADYRGEWLPCAGSFAERLRSALDAETTLRDELSFELHQTA